jgi:hypothetical protein
MSPSLNSPLYSGLKNLAKSPNGNGSTCIKMSPNLGMWLGFHEAS